VTVRTGDGETTMAVPGGANLRTALLSADFDVYGPLSRRRNCGGRGLCAACGVCLARDAPAAEHWHDRLAVTFGSSRRSCQVTVDPPLTVSLVDKRYWGQVLPRRYSSV
jgi:ferredoxin